MNSTDSERLMGRWRSLGQEHLFSFWEQRPADKKEALLSDLADLDPLLVGRLVDCLRGVLPQASPATFEPLPFVPEQQWRNDPEARAAGEALLASGKAAALTVAGGQGSRLGYEGPKGCFPISVIRRASLFQIFAEKILAARRRYGRPLSWFIMTSPMNREQTRSFFEEHSFFGLPQEEVLFFNQGLFPSLSPEGRLLLGPDGGLFKNPDGHGGTIRALREAGCLQHMKERGIEELFYFQVDNPLVRLPDPCFLGAHRLAASQLSSKVVAKVNPEEKLGAIGLIDGRPGIVEYSDLDQKRAQARDDQGRLLFSHGSIAIHIVNVGFLSQPELELPLHRAHKSVRVWVPAAGGGSLQQRQAVKFERFIFDAIPLADNPQFFETSREEEFAPVKNKTGQDSIETCRLGLLDLHVRWLERCGVRVAKQEGRALCLVEISPLFAPDAESLCRRLGRGDKDSLTEKHRPTVNIIDEDTLFA